MKVMTPEIIIYENTTENSFSYNFEKNQLVICLTDSAAESAYLPKITASAAESTYLPKKLQISLNEGLQNEGGRAIG